LGLHAATAATAAEAWRMLADRLLEFRYQGIQAAILLDDADRADRQVHVEVSRLATLDASSGSGPTLILAARRGRGHRVGERLLELADLRIELAPWQQIETEEYLRFTLARAERGGPTFEPGATVMLHELARGIPRRVRRLADLAWLAGNSRNLSRIGADLVESVYQELDVGGS
jgi:general secretion pathway protein A